MPPKSSFSEMFAKVKAGDCHVHPPYIPPTVEYAICKRCGAKVLRQVEAMESHEEKCGIHKARVEDEGKIEGRTATSLTWSGGDGLKYSRENESHENIENNVSSSSSETATSSPTTEHEALLEPSKLHKSFSTTTMELADTELCLRLSSESRNIFEDDVFQYYQRTGSTNVAGWQRYSVSFGAGRMGLEFEYDSKASRRLVVTKVSTEASNLGVRIRDILIGVGHRPVPRGTDPIAVHKHLVSCKRPVVLHFYRLHVRRVNAAWNPVSQDQSTTRAELEDEQNLYKEGDSPIYHDRVEENQFEHQNINQQEKEEEEEHQRSRLANLANAVWSRLPALSRSGNAEEDNNDLDHHEAQADEIEDFQWPPPSLIVDPERYVAAEDDNDAEDNNWSCLLSYRHRAVFIRFVKPALRPKPWLLVYDSIYDGMSLRNLYNRAARHKGAQLLLVRDDLHHVAGAFIDEPIKCVGDYFGTGECFVFEANPPQAHRRRSKIISNTSSQNINEDNNDNNDDENLLQIFRWVGPGGVEDSEHGGAHALDSSEHNLDLLSPPPLPSVIDNDMFVYATSEILAVGSGGGGEAIRLDEALEFGASRPCATYGTEYSLFGDRETFPVQRVQLWSFANAWNTSAAGSAKL